MHGVTMKEVELFDSYSEVINMNLYFELLN